MHAHRATILAAGIASLLLSGAPALAQIDEATAVNILRECAKIDDATARLACYDNNIRNVGGAARVVTPGRMQVPQGGAAPVAANSPSGFGAEDVRTPDRYAGAAGQIDEISTTVRAIRAREPGVYLLTLDDGAQWVFAEGVSLSYQLPQEGSTIGIERGALGSFLMYFDEQRPVPVRRVR